MVELEGATHIGAYPEPTSPTVGRGLQRLGPEAEASRMTTKMELQAMMIYQKKKKEAE
jgi:hypothetical protein